jgi:hypothetical protein
LIVASFNKEQNRTAAVSGAYQYDTGQRLVMHGLPSPPEMAGRDDLLSGDLVTVQAQFSYKGDSQADMRLAMWDEKRQVWLVDVPDEYLARQRDVHVYVFCYYGSDEIGERGETAYEATFRPISRPAPSGTVTEEQLRQWANLKAEIEISVSKVDNAIQNALDAAQAAAEEGERIQNETKGAASAASSVKQALNALGDAGGDLGNAEISVVSLPAGSQATASLDMTGSTGRLTLGIPRGNNGAQGEQGELGLSDITIGWDSGTKTLTITTN